MQKQDQSVDPEGLLPDTPLHQRSGRRQYGPPPVSAALGRGSRTNRRPHPCLLVVSHSCAAPGNRSVTGKAMTWEPSIGSKRVRLPTGRESGPSAGPECCRAPGEGCREANTAGADAPLRRPDTVIVDASSLPRLAVRVQSGGSLGRRESWSHLPAQSAPRQYGAMDGMPLALLRYRDSGGNPLFTVPAAGTFSRTRHPNWHI